MISCPGCAARLDEGSRFCSRCGAPLRADSVDPTRTSFSAARTSGSSPAEERFLPGTVVAGRYRIYGLLGRGGMGEVYRADDLTLGQSVALKFLPRDVERDETRRARLLNEVKLARQISHASVCRVYDVGDVGGRHFLSMEYVDGEDLASLLRRIGRLPREKAVEIARQLCAGLSAAHEQGVLHRDLKPANVMIDGRGRAKITDFGLAVTADGSGGAEHGAGTPAYMAPELLAGGAASIKSDLYALGLVLYELLAGERPFRADSMDDLARAQRESTPASLASRVDGLDPAIERAILRCLRSEPAERPGSALAVAASLPGGDPIAAALAAGETPSPELVANAGEVGRSSAGVAWGCIAAAALGVALVLGLSGRTQVTRLVPLDKSPEVLAERAKAIIAALGWSDPPIDTAFGFQNDDSYLNAVMAHDRLKDRASRLATGRPPAIRFWYRQGSSWLLPEESFVPYPSATSPPPTDRGMVSVLLDTRGRLEGFLAAPPERDHATAAANDPDPHVLFEAAGLDPIEMQEVPAAWTPPVFADRRLAWEGTYPGVPDVKLHIEAASYRGRWVSFRIVFPWSAPAEESEQASLVVRASSAAGSALIFGVLVGGFLVARRNVRLGRGDRRGTVRLVATVFIVGEIASLLSVHFVAAPPVIASIILSTSFPLLVAVSIGIFYLALEPYLRRIWPRMMISWVRLLDGRLTDPLVGRDVLIGLVVGVALRLLDQGYQLIAQHLGLAVPIADQLSGPPLDQILFGYAGVREAASNLVAFVDAGLLFPLANLTLLLLVRFLLRRDIPAMAGFLLLMTPIGMRAGIDPVGFLGWSLMGAALFLFVVFRFGLLAVVAGTFVNIMLVSFPMTPATSAWYSGRTVTAFGVLAALAVYGYRVTAGRVAASDARA